MSNSKNQAAESTTAAGATSADATQISGADWQAFTSAYRSATPQARRMVCHLIQAHAAGADRRIFAQAYHWAAFIAIDPPAAYRVTPALRRVVRGVCIGVCLALVLALMTGCGDGAGGGSSSAAALRAQFGAGSGVDNNAETTQPATPTPPAQISPTETPDMQPAQIEAPAQVIEVTRIVEVAQPAQVIEVTREVQTISVQVIEVTPQPATLPACDPNVPQPTIALDAQDIAAGVVMRGTGCLWVIQTAEAAQAVQP